jgi:hypothetical protein
LSSNIASAEQAEALDVLYLLRGSQAARLSLAIADVAPALASLLATCTNAAAPGSPRADGSSGDVARTLPTSKANSGGTSCSAVDLPLSAQAAAGEQRATQRRAAALAGRVAARDRAAELGLFSAPDATGAALHRGTIAGKAVRLLVSLARDAAAWHGVAACEALVAPLALLAARAHAERGGDGDAGARPALPPLPPLRVHKRGSAADDSAHADTQECSVLPAMVGEESSAGTAEEARGGEVPAPVADVTDATLDKMQAALFGAEARQAGQVRCRLRFLDGTLSGVCAGMHPARRLLVRKLSA